MRGDGGGNLGDVFRQVLALPIFPVGIQDEDAPAAVHDPGGEFADELLGEVGLAAPRGAEDGEMAREDFPEVDTDGDFLVGDEVPDRNAFLTFEECLKVAWIREPGTAQGGNSVAVEFEGIFCDFPLDLHLPQQEAGLVFLAGRGDEAGLTYEGLGFGDGFQVVGGLDTGDGLLRGVGKEIPGSRDGLDEGGQPFSLRGIPGLVESVFGDFQKGTGRDFPKGRQSDHTVGAAPDGETDNLFFQGNSLVPDTQKGPGRFLHLFRIGEKDARFFVGSGEGFIAVTAAGEVEGTCGGKGGIDDVELGMEVPGVSNLNRRFSPAELIFEKSEEPAGVGDLHILDPADPNEKPDVDLLFPDAFERLRREDLIEGSTADPGGADPDPFFRLFQGSPQGSNVLFVGNEFHDRLLSIKPVLELKFHWHPAPFLVETEEKRSLKLVDISRFERNESRNRLPYIPQGIGDADFLRLLFAHLFFKIPVDLVPVKGKKNEHAQTGVPKSIASIGLLAEPDGENGISGHGNRMDSHLIEDS